MAKNSTLKIIGSLLFLSAVGGIAFAAGLAWSSTSAHAESTASSKKKKPPRVLYPSKTELDFEGTQIEGEVRNPGEFYFQHRHEENFDSLVKRRKNFHREMLRDVVLSK